MHLKINPTIFVPPSLKSILSTIHLCDAILRRYCLDAKPYLGNKQPFNLQDTVDFLTYYIHFLKIGYVLI